ncbi:Acyl-CoA N-acyltransferase [Hirschfeldia incana]|nr:Acyl-CoA N-acyltransferase [Hirschfeldia incana]
METSPSIFLRPFDLSDAEDVLKWAGDDAVTRYLRWTSVRTVEEARQHILLTAIPHPWRHSISLVKDGRSIGCVSVRPDTGDGRCRADLGYAVAREFWGRGIATEAVRMAVEQAFEVFPEVVRLQAVVEVENKASQKVLEKAGFEKEGLLKKYGFCKGGIKDMFLYSFVKGEMRGMGK